MFLSAEHIQSLIDEGMVAGQKIFDLEGSMLLLTVKNLSTIGRYAKSPWIGVEKRYTPPYEKEPKNREYPDYWYLLNDRLYQVECNEVFQMPLDVMGFIGTRRTNFVSGLELGCTFISPGYTGSIMMKLSMPVEDYRYRGLYLQQDAPIAAVAFAKLSSGDTQPYKHKVWKDNKTHTEGEEVAY